MRGLKLMRAKPESEKKVRSSVAWYPRHLAWAKKEANINHGGSVSQLVAKLVEEKIKPKKK